MGNSIKYCMTLDILHSLLICDSASTETVLWASGWYSSKRLLFKTIFFFLIFKIFRSIKILFYWHLKNNILNFKTFQVYSALTDTMDKVYFLSFLSSHVNYLSLSDAGKFGDGGAWCFVLLTGNYSQKLQYHNL